MHNAIRTRWLIRADMAEVLRIDEKENEWLMKSEENYLELLRGHDTIGMVAMDANGNFSGSCTTSGAGFKMRGRVGDSPIIGAGLFVDNEVGACTATGQGEDVIRVAGSHSVVELMRQGYSPEEACKKVVERIIKIKGPKAKDIQVGFLAINKKGRHGAYAIHKGFSYALRTNDDEKLVSSKYNMA